MREAVLRPGARDYYDLLSDDDQRKIDHRLALLEDDPSVDGRVKHHYPRPPLILYLFDDGVWQIVYYLPDPATVAVHAIARSMG